MASSSIPAVDLIDSQKAPRETALPAGALGGTAYLAARYGLGVLVSVGNMLVMTWWLGPHIYGLFVTSISLVAFLATVSRAGVDTYLVRQKTSPEPAMYETANAIILIASFALLIIAAAITPLLARWYGEKEFVAPYLVLLATIPISGLAGVPMACLERDLSFRKIAAIELIGQSLGFVAAISLAWAKAGIWAAVAGQLVWQIVTLIATFRAAGLKLAPRLHHAHWKPMCSFGLGMTLSLRTWQLRTLVNPLLVGKLAGTDAVAFVALAIRIAEALGTIRLAAGRIAIAALARLQAERERFRSALERALFLQVITLGPLLSLFALAGPVVVRHLMGARWIPSLRVYPFVATGVLVNSIYNLQASALFVMEKQWIVMRAYTAHVAILGAGAWLLLPRCGIAGYGLAELAACGAYAAIHRGIAGSLRLSCRKAAFCAAAFTAILFLPRILTH
ncbi:MAG TPA: oligosaccharide flippase family protein [Terriglobales bacterium]